MHVHHYMGHSDCTRRRVKMVAISRVAGSQAPTSWSYQLWDLCLGPVAVAK
jgi:hypothetical protein